MKQLLFIGAFLLSLPLWGQYGFKIEKQLTCTSVKDQQQTGSCWSYTTISFLESELLRLGKPPVELSEMYMVRTIYQDKARNYILRQGKANFSQGALSHDVTRAWRLAGAMPQEAYDGKLPGSPIHDHGEMEAVLKGLLDGVLASKKPSAQWMTAFRNVLDSYMEAVPERFIFQRQELTPQSFAASLGIDPDDYLTFTSFSHHPFYRTFVLEIPDNYSNGLYYNLPLDELQALADHALANGYTIAWDGDVSEKGFAAGRGLAVLPADPEAKGIFDAPVKELPVNQSNRQQAFENFSTTDDHLMHITGWATGADNTRYYLVKNSWGAIGPYQGYLYMSAPYFRMKTVGVMVHRDAVPEDIARKCGLL
jgi:bleomycin hydrolase